MLKKAVAELIGTFWLTFGGCGSAVLAAAVFIQEGTSPINIGIGLVGVSLAFGLTVLTMAFAIGHISGCHLNPAVTVGLVVGKRFPATGAIPYILAQVAGSVLGAFLLFAIVSGKSGFTGLEDRAGVFATNGFGDFSPGKYSLVACLTAEVVLTAVFLFVILGATDRRAPAGLAPIAIGLGLTLIHLIGIPVTNLSVNPARSTGPALVTALNGAVTPITQLWLFWAAPILGAAAGAFLYQFVADEPSVPVK
ncbi:aquaporin Z [Gemmata sp. G18]|uniref:Aquaporin Z n=2 Tax=Gemmata palustris TaxID=2822762 RepID=A0ABS5C1T4_9BACT|nr:aquaporin Z [Gemmata palustris]MBP3959948.1 aquaporin Z [Gemmata palustris]